VTLQKIFFTSKFSYVLFCNPTHETETGTANRWGTTSSKPPGPIIMTGSIRNTDQQLDHIYYIFNLLRQPAQLSWAKTISLSQMGIRWIFHSLSQTGIRWFFFIQFYSAGSHTKHGRRCSYVLKQGLQSVTIYSLLLNGPEWTQHPPAHKCIHWMPIMTQLWMNFNWVNIWFDLG
jgi:hypothetical protein